MVNPDWILEMRQVSCGAKLHAQCWHPRGTFVAFPPVGGHSLLAMQIIARVSTAFGVELTPQTFLNAPSIVAMAEVILDTLLAHAEPLSIGTL